MPSVTDNIKETAIEMDKETAAHADQRPITDAIQSYSPDMEKDSDLTSEGLYLKVSESLAELMDSVPEKSTSQLLTNTLLSLVIRQNLGASLEEIKTCLAQAEKKRYFLTQELSGRRSEEVESINAEIKILDTTIETLSSFLVNAQKEYDNYENVILQVRQTKDSIQILENINGTYAKRLHDLEQKLLLLKGSDHIVEVSDEIDLKDIPKGAVVQRLVRALAILCVILVLLLGFSLSCNVFGKIGES